MVSNLCRRTASCAPARPVKIRKAYFHQNETAGGCVKMMEVLTPKNELSIHTIQAIRALALQADVLSLPSHPLGNWRMPNIDCFDQLKLDGEKTIIHYTVRGKSWGTIQSDLLKMHRIGIRKLLIVRGDEPKFQVEDPSSDIDAVAVVRCIKSCLNRGVSLEGTSLNESTSFHVGCAVNITPKIFSKKVSEILFKEDKAWSFQQERLKAKMEAGADFFITHPVFDAKKAVAFLDDYRFRFDRLRKPLYCGLTPFNSPKQVRHFATISEMEIPDDLQQELTAVPEGDLGSFQKKSLQLTLNIAGALIGGGAVSGFHIVAGSTDRTQANQLLQNMKTLGLYP